MAEYKGINRIKKLIKIRREMLEIERSLPNEIRPLCHQIRLDLDYLMNTIRTALDHGEISSHYRKKVEE